ncbi:hypothetical protein PTKIN_Ptkin04bG0070500 [Pterospermum kingtungense]
MVCATVVQLVNSMEKSVSNYAAANGGSSTTVIVSAPTWTAPLFRFYKVNVDAGFNVAEKSASCGMVVRDHGGNVILSALKGFHAIHSPLHAELSAILFGLDTIKAEGLLVSNS